jgi:hypothetical protein
MRLRDDVEGTLMQRASRSQQASEVSATVHCDVDQRPVDSKYSMSSSPA